MIITVSSEHIRLGRRMSCSSCPIAHALIDAGIRAPFVFETRFSCRVEGVRHWFKLPEAAFDFRWVFDYWGKAFPFTFEIPDAALGAW